MISFAEIARQKLTVEHVMIAIVEFRSLTSTDSISITIWNARKNQSESASGFLGYVQISPKAVSKLRDAGRQFFLILLNSID